MKDDEWTLKNDNKGVHIPIWMTFLLILLVVFAGVQGWYLYHLSGELRESRVEAKSSVKQSENIPDQADSSIPLPLTPQSGNGNSSNGNSLLQMDPFLQGRNWDPFVEMQHMRKRMDRLFGDAFNRFEQSDRFGNMFDLQFPISPRVDLRETEDAYEVTVEMPGAKEPTIKTTLEGQTLRIHAEADQQTETSSDDANSGSIVRRERWVSSFERAIQLPSPVDESAMRTEYNNGILTIHLPKAKS